MHWLARSLEQSGNLDRLPTPRHACKLLSIVVSHALVLVQEMSITSDIVSHIGPNDAEVRFLALLDCMN